MARLNIEEQFWNEINRVVAKVGDEDKAIGNAVRLFRFAQIRAKQGKPITAEDWRIQGFHESLVPIFATRISANDETFYEVVGAKKHFAWLEERVEAGRAGGVKSGESRRSEFNDLTEAKRSKPKQTEPSSSYSLSFSEEELNTKTTTSELEKLPTAGKPALVKIATSQELISKIPSITLSRWAALYPDGEFLNRELLKALNYYESNPRKLPKTVAGWSRTLASWFNRSWEWSAKNTKGNSAAAVNIDEILKGLNRD